MTISAFPMTLLELCFKYNFNLYISVTPTLIIKLLIICLAVHTPKVRKCLKILFVTFESDPEIRSLTIIAQSPQLGTI